MGGYYRPAIVHRAEIGIDANGMPAAWRHVIVGQSLVAGTPFERFMIKNGVDQTLVEGTGDTHYELPNFAVSVHQPTVNVPVLWWRSVGNTHTAFVMETLIDELATRANAEPIAYRRKLLNPEAKGLLRTLDLLEQNSTWRDHLPSGHAAGIACHECFGTSVACAAHVSLEDGRPRIHRVTVAVDPGMAINPLTVEAQFQGGVIFGLTQLMPKGAITLKDGYVEQSNFDRYTPPYMGDAPVAIDVYIVPSTGAPTGCGEPPVPVISPAVVNALFRLTGKRYRTLPLSQL
jgi:isoquinoline 1-oxidoreductase beta subunit